MWIVVQLELSEAMMQMLTPWNVSTHHSSLPQPEDESLETVQTAPLSQPYFLHGYSAWDLRSDSNPLPMHRFSGMKWPDALTPFPHMLNCCGKLVTPALSADTNPPILVIAVMQLNQHLPGDESVDHASNAVSIRCNQSGVSLPRTFEHADIALRPVSMLPLWEGHNVPAQ